MPKSRWTPEMVEEAVRLRWEDKWTLEMIGEKFGVCRERIRQVIGNTNFKSYKSTRINQEDLDTMSVKELQKKYNVSKPVLYRLRSKIYLNPIINKLKDIGLSVRRCKFAGKYLWVNGYLVTVAITEEASKANLPKLKNPSYCFRIHMVGLLDFAILYIKSLDVFFVIPQNELKTQEYIRMVYPSNYKNTRYQKFANRFDLLKQPY